MAVECLSATVQTSSLMCWVGLSPQSLCSCIFYIFYSPVYSYRGCSSSRPTFFKNICSDSVWSTDLSVFSIPKAEQSIKIASTYGIPSARNCVETILNHQKVVEMNSKKCYMAGRQVHLSATDVIITIAVGEPGFFLVGKIQQTKAQDRNVSKDIQNLQCNFIGLWVCIH